MRRYLSRYKIGFSLQGMIAFLLQELPYVPWLLCPPSDNPLYNNLPASPMLGFLEQAGGVLTVVFLILIQRKPSVELSVRSPLFTMAVMCLAVYYISWVLYFMGYTHGWLIIIGLSAIVPLYYLFVGLWLRNNFAVASSLLFFIGHTFSNAINFG